MRRSLAAHRDPKTLFDKNFEELRMTGNLPSPSGIGLAILQLTQDNELVLTQLARTISADPALSGKILKLANSVMEVGDEPVTDVLSASTLLGVRSVRSVALGFSLTSANRSGVCSEFDYQRYWALSLSSAVVAQCIADRTEDCCSQAAFTCALLSRVGMLALASVHPLRYSKALRRTRGNSLTALLEAETNAFEITHAEITAALLCDWGLPDSFQEVALRLGQRGRQIEALPTATLRLLSVVNAAWMLAPKLMTEGGSAAAMAPGNVFLPGVARRSGVDEQVLANALIASEPVWSEWRGTLELGASSSPKATGPMLLAEEDVKPDLSDLLEDTEDRVALDPLVMIVDDDERIIRLLEHVLKKDELRYVVARNGRDALALAAEHHPQIIITDWNMPKMSGLELCQGLQKSEVLRSSYVIMLSAQESIDYIEEGFAAGADDYVCKPFSVSVLRARVRAGKRVLGLQAQLDRERDARTRQMAEMGAITRKLRAVTMTDTLTELPNRRYARRRLRDEWESSVHRGEALSLVMVDIDHFKNVNDVYGHDVGDHVLRETARVLKENTRDGDVVCRFGGEEFLVINVDCPRRTALQFSERLRSAVEANHIVYGDFDGHVTISLGVAERTRDCKDMDELIRAADQAVYRAKGNGRNRTEGGTEEYDRRSA